MIQLLNTKRNDEQFDCLFSRTEQIAERLEVDFKPKRSVGHRENTAPDTSPVKLADRDLYPNIHTISKLYPVLPVTSVCCKHSFSALRRILKTWVRSTMTE